MPFDGSGTASIVNSFTPSTTISSSQVNANFTDIATMLTNTLPRDGQAAMTGQLKATDGTSSAPGITFGSDLDTGFYRSGANTVKFVTASGTVVATFASTGITIGAETDPLTNPATTRGDILARGASALGRVAIGTVGQLLASDGTDPGWVSKNTLASDNALINGKLAFSVGSSALTVAVKTLAGADPSAADAVFVRMPDGSGGWNFRSITAALSVVISSGSTIGATNSIPFRLWIGALDNAGTVELFAINARSTYDIVAPAEFSTVTTTAEGGGGAADSAQVPYSTTQRIGKQFRWVGFGSWESGLATVGTWSAGPTSSYLVTPSTPRPGRSTGLRKRVALTSAGNTGAITAGTLTDITGVSLSITPNSACNLFRVHSVASFGVGTGPKYVSTALLNGSTVIERGDAASNRHRAASGNDLEANAGWGQVVTEAWDFPGTTSAVTYKLQATVSGNDTLYWNQSATDTDSAGFGRFVSTISAEEIMG